MLKYIIFSFCCILSIQSFAQLNASWSTTLDGTILWQEVTPLGDVIVATSSAIYGINPASGEVVWQNNNLANVMRSQFNNIPASTFVSVNVNESFYIIEPSEGLVVFDSEEANMLSVLNHYFLYKNNGILVSGNDASGNETLVMVGMNSGKVFWELTEDFGRIIAVEEITSDEILIVNLFHSFLIDSGTGEIIWKNATSKQTGALEKLGALGSLLKSAAEEMSKGMDFDLSFYLSPDKTIYVLATTKKVESTVGENTTISFKNVYTAFEIANGEEVWEKPVEMNGKVGHAITLEKGFLVLPDNGNRTKINLLEYKSGIGKWGKKGKGTPIKGGVYDYLAMKEGILIVTRTNNNDFVNILDPTTGLIKFEKPSKISGRLVNSMPVGAGILCITDDQINILNTGSGELLLGKAFKTRPELSAMTENSIFAYDVKESIIKRINVNTAAIENLFEEKLKFEGNESPNAIELRDNSIFLNSDQNVALTTLEGNISYQNYFPAPRESGWKRALLYAQAIRASLISAQAYYTSGVMQVAEPYAREENALAGDVVGELGNVYNDLGNVASDYAAKAFRAAGNRFKATSGGRDFQIILTQLKDKSTALVKVNKNSGEIENKIDLGKDKEPVYAVDDVLGTVFLKSGSSEIACYEF